MRYEIPDNALELIDELIQIADSLAYDSREAFEMDDMPEIMLQVGDLASDMQSAIRTFVFTWFGIDPLEYDFDLVENDAPRPSSILFSMHGADTDIPPANEQPPACFITKEVSPSMRDILSLAMNIGEGELISTTQSSACLLDQLREFRKSVEISLRVHEHDRIDMFQKMKAQGRKLLFSEDQLTCWAILADGTEEVFELTTVYSDLIQILYRSYLRGGSGMHQSTVLTKLKPVLKKDTVYKQLMKVFPNEDRLRFGRLIVKAGRAGFYKLNLG